MPGLHFILVDPNKHPLDNIDKALEAHGSVTPDPRETIYRDDHALVTVTRYPDYPLAVFDSERYLIILEGCLSGVGDSSRDTILKMLADMIFDEIPATETIRDWLLSHGGDFVILVREKKTGRWGCVNDYLGRLPLYYFKQEGLEVLTRDITLAAACHKSPEMDRMALAQYLLFGFPLGHRTLLKDIKRLSPAVLLRWGAGEEHRRWDLFEFNFDHRHRIGPVEEEAERLESLFIPACRKLAECRPGQPLVLSLSGGLDSRAVAAGLDRAGIPFDAVTFEDYGKTMALDIVYAREVARQLSIEWHPFHLPAPAGSDMMELMALKGGMNSASMSFYIPFLKLIKKRWGGGINYITGDGGDKALPPLQPSRRFSSDAALAEFIVARHDVMAMKSVALLSGISEEEIEDELGGIIGTYPETEHCNKYVHFLIYERAFKWLFEGEDRNRGFFWSATPFYDPAFFQAAMACPDSLKRNHCLYSEFLKRLSPKIAGIVDMNRGVAVTSAAYRRKEKIFSILARYPQWSRRLKNRISPPNGYAPSSTTVQYLMRLADRDSVINEYLLRAELKKICEVPHRLSRTAMDNLLTVAAMIEFYIEGKQPLLDYADEIFN